MKPIIIVLVLAGLLLIGVGSNAWVHPNPHRWRRQIGDFRISPATFLKSNRIASIISIAWGIGLTAYAIVRALHGHKSGLTSR